MTMKSDIIDQAAHIGQPLADFIIDNPHWPMKADVLSQLCEVVARHCDGVRLPVSEIADIVAARTASQLQATTAKRADAVRAVIPVSGVIAKYSRLVNGVSQPRGTSVETIREQLRTALADDNVNDILLHIESPGGSIAGLADLADEIFEANKQKPVIAFADDMAASAAYWLGSQASKFYANQSAMVGSIGVYSVYVDSSRWAENLGLRVHVVGTGTHKGTGVDGAAISPEQLDAIQAEVDTYFASFKAAVLRGRGKALSAEQLDDVADGRVFIGQEAVKLGLIDGVRTFDAVLQETSPARTARASTSIELPDGQATDDPTNGGSTEMSDQTDKQTLDAEAIRKEAEDKARAAERERLTALKAAFPDDEPFAVKQFEAGSTVEQAKVAYCDVLAEKVATVTKERDEAAAKAEKAAKFVGGVPPIGGGDDADDDPDNAQAETYLDAAAAYAKEHKCSMRKAYSAVAKERPELYAKHRRGK